MRNLNIFLDFTRRNFRGFRNKALKTCENALGIVISDCFLFLPCTHET